MTRLLREGGRGVLGAGPDKAGLGTAHTARSSNTQLKISPTRPFCCLETSQHNTPGSELVARKQELSHSPTHSQSHHSITPPEITGLHIVLVTPAQTSDQCLDTGSVLMVTAPCSSCVTANNDVPPLAPDNTLLIRVLSHHRDCDNCTTSLTTLHLTMRALT